MIVKIASKTIFLHQFLHKFSELSSSEDSSMHALNLNISLHSSTPEATEENQKESEEIQTSAVPAKKKATKRQPRKRNLRAEDERTLEILEGKFRCDAAGAKCQIESCNSDALKCMRPSNLKRHLMQRHPKEFSNLFPNEVNHKKRAELEAFNILQDSIELVTVNGYPFSMLEASGMQGFLKPRLQNVRSEGHMFSVNRHQIVKEVAKESNLIREYIKNEMKGKLVSVMFDVCTIATLSMLGVNSVFMKNGEVVCRSLGTIEIRERHTAVQLANMLYDILSKFNVRLPRVFSVTSDTAKNATATSRVLNSIANSNKDDINDSEHDETNDDYDLFGESEFGMDIENEAELQKVIDNIAAHTRLVSEMTEDVTSNNDKIVVINQINCGTHVFQLCVNAALNESNAKSTIGKVHDMCVLLRTQVVMIEVRKIDQKIIIPPLMNATRWNTEFIMVFELIIFAKKSLSFHKMLIIVLLIPILSVPGFQEIEKNHHTTGHQQRIWAQICCR